MFLAGIQILLNNICSERERDWSLHLDSVYGMIPYFFAANKQNYSRWAPIYLLDMMNLHAEVESAFNDGQFSIALSAGKFKSVWTDMNTKSKVIKDSNGEGA